MTDLERENERQRVELERDRSTIAHLRSVTKAVELLNSLPIDVALLALRAVHGAATGGAGPIAAELARAAGEALVRRVT